MRRNPKVGMHPDLFESDLVDVPGDPKKAMWAPEDTAVVIPLSDMTEAEIKKTPRANFSQTEFDSLDEDVQEYIHEHGDSLKRIDYMVKKFVDLHEWTTGERGNMDWINQSIGEDFDQSFSEYADELVEMADNKGYDVDEFVEEMKNDGYSEEQARAALLEALQDNNNWDYEYNTDEYGKAFFKGMYRNSYYMSREDLDEATEGLYPDEIEVALEEINRKTYLSLKPKDLGTKHGGHWDRELDIDDYADFYGDADPNWDRVTRAANVTLQGVEPEGTGETVIDESLAPEERIVHRFKDGSYVLDLLPDELPAEGKAMGMCVGRPDMGYAKAVREGRTKILSLRTQAGRPKFTFELALRGGKPVEVEQIKGKANRLPGWDIGKQGQGEMKRDEVEKVIEVVEALGLDPRQVDDLQPAFRALPPKQNPGATCRKCGALHTPGRKSFCDPVGA